MLASQIDDSMNNEGALAGQNVVELTAGVMSAYVSNNSVSASDSAGADFFCLRFD
jgi:hypothetical protein